MLPKSASVLFAPVLFTLVIGCTQSSDPEDTEDWFGDMGPMDEDVVEPVEFTDRAYDWGADDPDVTDLDSLFEDFTRYYAPDDLPPDASCGDWLTTPELPQEMWVMVTLHPRYYFKTDGCENQAVEGDSEEKYYGSFFAEDNSGGIFVLGDSKVAHFDMGDRIKLRVRGVQRRFGLDMVVAHDVVEVDRGPYPIFFKNAPAELDNGEYPEDWIGDTVRVEGTVTTEPDTFGEFTITSDSGQDYLVALDSELNRRKVGDDFPIGTRMRATGPLQRAFGDKIVVLRIGQLEPLDE